MSDVAAVEVGVDPDVVDAEGVVVDVLGVVSVVAAVLLPAVLAVDVLLPELEVPIPPPLPLLEVVVLESVVDAVLGSEGSEKSKT